MRHKLENAWTVIGTAGHNADVLNDGKVPVQLSKGGAGRDNTLAPGGQAYIQDLSGDLKARSMEPGGSVLVQLKRVLRD